MMLELVILIISVAVSVFMGMLVLWRDTKRHLHQLFFVVMVVLVVMSIANYLSLNPNFDQLFWVKTVMSSTVLVIALFYIFIKMFNSNTVKSAFNWFDKLIMMTSLAFAIVQYTDFTFTAVEPTSPAKPILGTGAWVFFVYFMSIMFLCGRTLYMAAKLSSKNIKKQNVTLLVGVLPVLLFAPFTGFILPIVFGYGDLIIITPVYGAFFTVVVGYAIARYGLFDIKQATMRTVGYALTVATMAGVYVGLAYAISLLFFKGQIVEGISFSPLNIVLALVLAFIFQPIKRFFDRVTNRLFYQGEYDRDVFFKDFGRILSHDTDLKLLLRQSGQYIEANLKADKTFFYLIGRGIYVSSRAKKPAITQAEILEIVKFYKKMRLDHEALQTDLIEDSDVKAIFHEHHIAIALPLLAKKQVMGFLFLGEHKSRGYSRRDLLTLESIINELAIAVQNSLSVEEIRELNTTLQESINEATHELRVKNQQLRQLDEVKDEFLSIASHQLRTPLTSIKGYINMMLEGDFGKISPGQYEILNDVFVSSERMVQLINDFLNVSRIQTGKFAIELRKTNLSAMIEKEIELLSAQIEQHQLEIDWRHDVDLPSVAIDDDKIRQVVMNMIDNAIYYSKANTTIKVLLHRQNDQLIFTVTDTGIGVPAKEQASLFGKFFRASNARKRRPDGTGVGLYLAKKIIDAHGGTIIFESEEGKGSTFGFELPLK